MSEVSRTMRYLTLLLTRISTSTLPFQAYCKQKLHGIFQLICHLCTRLILEIWFPHAATDFESTILLLQSQDPNCYRLTLSIIQWYSIEDSFHFLLCLKSHGGKAISKYLSNVFVRKERAQIRALCYGSCKRDPGCLLQHVIHPKLSNHVLRPTFFNHSRNNDD